MIKEFDIILEAEEIKKERAKAGEKHVAINGNTVTIYTGDNIPKD